MLEDAFPNRIGFLRAAETFSHANIKPSLSQRQFGTVANGRWKASNRGRSLAPSGEKLAFRTRKGRVEFTVPELRGHQMVEIAF